MKVWRRQLKAGERYPVGGAPRNRVCIPCRISNRATWVCPQCGGRLTRVRPRYRVPKRGDTKAWAALEAAHPEHEVWHGEVRQGRRVVASNPDWDEDECCAAAQRYADVSRLVTQATMTCKRSGISRIVHHLGDFAPRNNIDVVKP